MLKAQILIPGLGSHQVLSEGDTIYDFRGDTHTFVCITRMSEPGRSGKVLVKTKGRDAEYYDHVFPGLSIVKEED